MAEVKRIFVPWAEYLPDQKYFENQGLLTAEGVVPVYGDYFQSPGVNNLTSVGDFATTGAYYGLHAHPRSASPGWTMYGPTASKIWEISASGVKTDRSGAAYATPGTDSGAQFVSYGDSVIETRYTSPPNILLSGAGAFTALHTATFSPAAKFACVVRNNLFLANCSLPAPYDGLAAGANPQLVAWSGTDAPRSFGSLRADPQIVGAGYQPLNNDFGPITGAYGGDDFGLIFQSRGIVRVDGPPYQFGAVIRGHGCRYPNSIVGVGADIYFWGEGGPSVIRNGGQISVLRSLQAQVEVLGKDKLVRSLIDNVTPAGVHPVASGIPPINISAYADLTNRVIFWAYTTAAGASAGASGDYVLAYNYDEDRFATFAPGFGFPQGALFLRQRPETGDPWLVGRNGVFVFRDATGGAPGTDLVSTWFYNNGGLVNFQTGFMQLDPQQSTRIRRVRPVNSRPTAASLTQTITILSTSDPKGAQAPTTRGPYSTADSNGWIATPDADFSDFNAVRYGCDSGGWIVSNHKGFEVEYETGGAYS